MHRDWELVDVLATTVGSTSSLAPIVADVRKLIRGGRRQDALDALERSVRPVVAPDDRVAQILEDLLTSLNS
jgi:hypothetical protein